MRKGKEHDGGFRREKGVDRLVVEESGRWEELNPEILALIFVRVLPVDEMVRNVPLVCKPWMEVVEGPCCWRDIDVAEWCQRHNESRVVDLAVRKLVYWSNCTFQLLSVYRLGNIGFDFVAKHARCLTVLQIPMSEITDDMVVNHVKSLPNLRVLDISDCYNITVKGLEAFGNQCKSLVSLKRNMSPQRNWPNFAEPNPPVDDSEANVIANSMLNLQHLELCYGCFGEGGLSEILTKCKSLTCLDIQGSWNVKLEGDIEERLQRIEYFKSPCAYIDYIDEFYDSGEDSL
ncbi:F-box protein FBW2 [Lactuca sativa]|uniref:F-box protein FBW2 n=1 Tax=Lactuca sativa TaxID=4236 RepID=UPI000CC5C774|nr:F-box protein FBW2 [Lactuca sativa]